MSENLIGQIITAIVTLVLAFIGYLKLKGGQDKLREDVDGKMTQLLETTGDKERAKGKEERRVEERAEKIEDSATPAAVVDVKIVDQDKAVKVVTEKPIK